MASRPDGKSERTDRVNFTRSAAERISRVVRIVERGDRDAAALSFERPQRSLGKLRLQLGTFTGDWATGQYKTVTLTNTTQTVSVYNWCNPALGGNTSSSTESRYVIFGNVAGTQSAVEIQLRTTQCTATLTLGSVDLTSLPGFVSGDIQLLGHGAGSTASTCSGGLQWYSITTCA